jgi:hypothetical protein
VILLQKIKSEFDINVDESTISRFSQKCNFTWKKQLRIEQWNAIRVLEQRADFIDKFLLNTCGGEVIYIDETGFQLASIVPVNGHALSGEQG